MKNTITMLAYSGNVHSASVSPTIVYMLACKKIFFGFCSASYAFVRLSRTIVFYCCVLGCFYCFAIPIHI